MMTLSEFIATYDADENLWWTLDSGEHQRLFDIAVARIGKLDNACEEASYWITRNDDLSNNDASRVTRIIQNAMKED